MCPDNGIDIARQRGRDQKGGKQEVARSTGDLRSVDEDKGGIDIERTLLRHPRQRGQDDLLRLSFDYFDHRRAFDAAFFQNLPENRRLKYAEPDVEADPDHDDREPERDAPTPCQELITRDRAESQHREVGEEQSGRVAPLGPGRNETAMGVGARPFHGHQSGTTHSPPIPRPRIKRTVVRMIAPQMPIES